MESDIALRSGDMVLGPHAERCAESLCWTMVSAPIKRRTTENGRGNEEVDSSGIQLYSCRAVELMGRTAE